MIFSPKNKKNIQKKEEKKIRKGLAVPVPVLTVRGMILPDGFEGPLENNWVSPGQIYSKLKYLREFSPKPQYLVIEINSPGGAITASSEIHEMVATLGEEYHTLGWVRDIAASGGYEVACGCKEIYAHSTSLVGSIGVLMGSNLEFSGLLKRLGIKYRRLTAGQYKDIGSPFRSMEEEEEKFLERHLKEAHQYFQKVVQKSRNLSEEKVSEVSSGLFWHGSQAQELGLVDHLGGLLDIQKRLEKELKKEVIFLFEEKESPDFWRQIFSFFHLPWQGKRSPLTPGNFLGAPEALNLPFLK